MKNHRFFEKVKNYLLYAGNDKEMFKQVQGQIDAANLKALRYWTVLVSFFCEVPEQPSRLYYKLYMANVIADEINKKVR